MYEKVIEYIKEKKLNFDKGKVFLVVGGLVIGSLFIQNYKYSNLKDQLEPDYQYVENIDIFRDNKPKENTIANPPVVDKDNSPIQETEIKKSADPKQQTVINNYTLTSKPDVGKSTTTVDQASPPSVTPTPPPVTSKQIVTLYRSTGTVEQINLEDYVIGVVSSEMPASFNVEALKAQSVLARTYALKKIDQNKVLTDTTSTQVYKDTNQLKAMWGSSFQIYYDKVKDAVTSTKSEYLTYDGNYIEAVYHSTSNGQTEDAAAVWGNSYPYLKSVDSHWDLDASSYLRESSKGFNVLNSIIGLDFNANTNIEVLSKTSSNRVEQIKINDKIFSGVEFRALLGLRSTDFDIQINDDQALFITRGYGHGVGMSQYGANGMAKEGYSYREILFHYYPGTQIKK